MIGFSYASSSTYLCNLDQDYSVERHNLVERDKEYIIHEFGINLPDKFMLKKFDDYVILKDMPNGKKTKLTSYLKNHSINKNTHYLGNNFTDDKMFPLDLLFAELKDINLFTARLIDLHSSVAINFGFYNCTQVDF